MTAVFRPSASGHTLNMLQLISLSCLNRLRRSRTVAPSSIPWIRHWSEDDLGLYESNQALSPIQVRYNIVHHKTYGESRSPLCVVMNYVMSDLAGEALKSTMVRRVTWYLPFSLMTSCIVESRRCLVSYIGTRFCMVLWSFIQVLCVREVSLQMDLTCADCSNGDNLSLSQN